MIKTKNDNTWILKKNVKNIIQLGNNIRRLPY